MKYPSSIPTIIADMKVCKYLCRGYLKCNIMTVKGSISIMRFAIMNVGVCIIFLSGNPIAKAGPKWNGVKGKIFP